MFIGSLLFRLLILTYFKVVFTILGLTWGCFRVQVRFKSCFSSALKAKQHSFSTMLFIMTFNFNLFLGFQWGSNTVLVSTHIADQLIFSKLPSILTFYFDLIFGHYWLLGVPMRYFLTLNMVLKYFLVMCV